MRGGGESVRSAAAGKRREQRAAVLDGHRALQSAELLDGIGVRDGPGEGGSEAER